MAVRTFHVFKYHLFHLRCSVVHRVNISGLDISGLAVGITEIEAVDHQRCHHMVQRQISENDIAENCIFSSAATGLDTQTSVCMTENTVFHCQIYHAACHFTSQSYGTVAVLHKALTDMDILGRSLMLFAHVDLTALDCNTVISQGKTHTQDLHIFAGFRIQSVGVGGIAGILHGDTDEFQIIAEIGMQGPGRGIAEGHTLQSHIFTSADEKQSGTECNIHNLRILPPVFFGSIAVDLTLPIDHHILCTDTTDNAGEHR